MKLLTRRTARPAGVRLAPLRLDYRTNYPLSAELYIDLGEISADDQGLEVAVAAVALGRYMRASASTNSSSMRCGALCHVTSPAETDAESSPSASARRPWMRRTTEVASS